MFSSSRAGLTQATVRERGVARPNTWLAVSGYSTTTAFRTPSTLYAIRGRSPRAGLGVVTLLVTHLPKLANSGRQWPNSLVHETPDFIGILSPADIG
jgi:hypothetical protein